uniref:Cytochrome n=1 Tax=Macrostomum lignano TaxID=282301 RepID=A0A1I8J8Y5_9PLAT
RYPCTWLFQKIEEVHRKSCLAPFGVFHRVTEDITVGGVRLKADSICAFNVYSIHHDPELLPEPQRFLPERHLKDGQFAPCPHLATFPSSVYSIQQDAVAPDGGSGVLERNALEGLKKHLDKISEELGEQYQCCVTVQTGDDLHLRLRAFFYMATATVALAGGAVALGLYWLKRKLDDAREPPSVGRYPLVGSYFHLDEPLYLSMYEKFGTEPIVRVHFGTQCVFFFNRWPVFKEAMIDNAEQLTGRLPQYLLMHLLGRHSANRWRNLREYRRFTLKTLRDFGFGRHGAEEIIAIEAEHMVSTLDAAAGEPVETLVVMSTATSNVICQLVFGSRLASEDERFSEMLNLFRNLTQNSMWIRPGDYIEAHLLHQRKHPELFNDKRLTLAVSDLFVAGTDTTANSLRWAILYMIGNPDMAEKAHKEIVDVIGRDRLPKMQDKPSLHYTQAVIEEVHRKSCLAPFGVFHRVTEDITVGGVRLKADSICAFNVYSIHHDPELFPEPQRFLPERHLKDGQFAPCPHLATFGLGKRACLGESLARMELFIFFTALMQRYRFGLDPEDSRTLWHLTEDPEFSKGTLLRAPPLHKIVFTQRA